MSQGGKHLFSSESVTEGHPDKICDQISDAVVDDLTDGDSWKNVFIKGTGRFERGGPFADAPERFLRQPRIARRTNRWITM